MGYILNTKAYELFIQLEVGLREFLIACIRNHSVNEWANNFLGTIQRETIADVVKRINEAYKNHSIPELPDQYFLKIERAKKENNFLTLNLFHPFYYLNWTDLENLIRMQNNAILIDNQIGKKNRETIAENLKSISSLRNDIAHSRFITEDNYKLIKACHISISALIPNFDNLINTQSSEKTIKTLVDELKLTLNKIEATDVLSIDELDVIELKLTECLNSFWLNSENLDLVKAINHLKENMYTYKLKRESQGGLLEIQKLKPKLKIAIQKIKPIIHG